MNEARPNNSTQFNIYGIVPYDKINGSYNLILKDTEDLGKMVSIAIGGPEAQSIAIFLEGVEFDRPFTHDLICNIIMDRSVDLEYVVIDDVLEQTYFATMAFSDGIMTDCRPSDGVSVAIRMGSPIFINNDVIDSMSFEYRSVKGIEESNEEKEKEKKKAGSSKKKKNELLSLSKEELDEKLSEAIEKEDYELAAKIRDLISKKR